jgi:DHHC palmitoyltransferase
MFCFYSLEVNTCSMNTQVLVSKIWGFFVLLFVWFSVAVAYRLTFDILLPALFSSSSPFLEFFISTLLSVLFALLISCHLRAWLSDPGFIDNKLVSSDAEFPVCKKCSSPKPFRAHHCSTCNKCVFRMDHHCVFVNNCVGYGNLKFFIQFLVYVFAVTAFILILQLILLMRSSYNLMKTTGLAFDKNQGQNLFHVGTKFLGWSSKKYPKKIYEGKILGKNYFFWEMVVAHGFENLLTVSFFANLLLFAISLFFLWFSSDFLTDQIEAFQFDSTLIECLQKTRAKIQRGFRSNFLQIFGKIPLLWFLPIFTSEQTDYLERTESKKLD